MRYTAFLEYHLLTREIDKGNVERKDGRRVPGLIKLQVYSGCSDTGEVGTVRSSRYDR